MPPDHPITIAIVMTGVAALMRSRYITSKPKNTSTSPRSVMATLPDVSAVMTVLNATELPVMVTATPGGGAIHCRSSSTIAITSSMPVSPISPTASPISRLMRSISLP